MGRQNNNNKKNPLTTLKWLYYLKCQQNEPGAGLCSNLQYIGLRSFYLALFLCLPGNLVCNICYQCPRIYILPLLYQSNANRKTQKENLNQHAKFNLFPWAKKVWRWGASLKPLSKETGRSQLFSRSYGVTDKTDVYRDVILAWKPLPLSFKGSTLDFSAWNCCYNLKPPLGVS